VRVQQRHRPKQRRRGRVLRRKEEIKEVTADLGVGGERCHRLSGELGLLDFPQRFLHPVINKTRRLFPFLHPGFAHRGAGGECFDEPVYGEPRVSKPGAGEVNRKLHKANVE